MRRRSFITMLGGAAAGWPLAARAQQASKAARIGYLAFRSPISADDAFLKGLLELGWAEGENIVIERRFAAGNLEQLKSSAAELVRLKVDVIVTAASLLQSTGCQPCMDIASTSRWGV
jgi:putative ABC transport system substrate-binding protein